MDSSAVRERVLTSLRFMVASSRSKSDSLGVMASIPPPLPGVAAAGAPAAEAAALSSCWAVVERVAAEVSVVVDSDCAASVGC